MTWRVRPVVELDATADKCLIDGTDPSGMPIPLCGHPVGDPACRRTAICAEQRDGLPVTAHVPAHVAGMVLCTAPGCDADAIVWLGDGGHAACPDHIPHRQETLL